MNANKSEFTSFPCTGKTSPRLEDVPGDVTKRYIKSIKKIRRLAPRHPFPAKLAYFVSPSSIWVRLPNHITSNLELTSSKDLNRATIDLHEYVMAPVRPNCLGRARILKLSENKSIAYVYFIDAGQTGKVNASNMYELPNGFACHPWQTVPLKLFAIDPANGTDWSVEEVSKLQTILDRYSHFWITPICSTEYPDDECCFISANVHGLTDTEYEELFTSKNLEYNVGDNIATLYNFELIMPQIHRVDGAEQRSYLYYDKNLFNTFPERPFDKEDMIPPQINSKFYLNNPYPQLKADFTSTFLLEGYTLWAFTTLSDQFALEINKPNPNLFFAHRLDRKKGKPNDVERFRRFAEEACDLGKKIDDFYFLPCNQHRLEFCKVYERLRSGQRVFGIVESYRKTPYFTVKFQRVEVLHCIVRDDGQRCFYRVRFLDVGGIDMVTSASVYHIHQNHMIPYPMSYILYYSCLSYLNDTWNNIHLELFNNRYLKPNRVFLIKLVVNPGTTIDLSKPLHVKSIVGALKPDEKSIENLMAENGHAMKKTNYAVIDDIYKDLRFSQEVETTKKSMEIMKSARMKSGEKAG